MRQIHLSLRREKNLITVIPIHAKPANMCKDVDELEPRWYFLIVYKESSKKECQTENLVS